jgi:DNA-binding GntR family transcriptional regulator
MKRDVLPSLSGDTLTSKVYASLEEAIVHGKIKPGDRLIEDELSSAFGVSRAPIREAFRLMERDGLVRVIPRRGALVNDMSKQDIRESYELLSVVEGLAARQFCENAGKQEIANLQKMCKAMEAHVSNGNSAEYQRLNKEFHALIVQGSRSKKLQEIHNHIRKQLEWFQNVTLSSKGQPEISFKEHKQIVNAFVRRDPDRAEEEVRKHILRPSTSLKDTRRSANCFKSSTSSKESPRH